MKKLFSTHTLWEESVGYSRAVQVNNQLFISGTAAVDESGKVHGENIYEQAKYIYEKIAGVLRESGFSFEDTVRVVVYLTDMEQFGEYARAHAEIFHAIRPAATCVEVSRLVNKDLFVEIELTALKPSCELPAPDSYGD